MKLDLHTHTDHSPDGRMSPRELVERAVRLGLDAIAITDHNTMSALTGTADCSEAPVIIPGMEITIDGGTHIIGLFLRREIVSRDIFDVIDEIHHQGGLVVIPHPFRPSHGLLHNKDNSDLYSLDDMARIMTEADLIEAANSHCRLSDIVETDKFLDFYPGLAHSAGSDAHCIDDVGRACLELPDFASGSPDEIKQALLEEPRTIRYEAYRAETDRAPCRVRIVQRKRSLVITRGRRALAPLKRSLKGLIERTGSKIRSRKKVGADRKGPLK